MTDRRFIPGLRVKVKWRWDPMGCERTPASVTVEMGEVSFLSTKIPVVGNEREVLRERMDIGGSAPFVTGAAMNCSSRDKGGAAHLTPVGHGESLLILKKP